MTRATLSDALMLATTLHRGQKDKAGQEYILHPLRVMHFLGSGASEDERIAALLHDTLEDCGMTPEILRGMGYSESVIAALVCVTKESEDEDYDIFIARCARNPAARRVKLADLRDNMDLKRIASPSQKDHERIEKYERARRYLEAFGDCV